LFYELALDQGNLKAATAAAQTYDPVYLKEIRVFGAPGNPDMAAKLYRRAIEAGDLVAVERLKKLTAWKAQ
jgi:TPR repeat protein